VLASVCAGRHSQGISVWVAPVSTLSQLLNDEAFEVILFSLTSTGRPHSTGLVWQLWLASLSTGRSTLSDMRWQLWLASLQPGFDDTE
jgi:hypothetical protein